MNDGQIRALNARDDMLPELVLELCKRLCMEDGLDPMSIVSPTMPPGNPQTTSQPN